ncbi:O-antigen ligase family protein [Lachnospiraceae bacterium JLR.KK009]
MERNNTSKYSREFEIIFFIMTILLLGICSVYFLYKFINPSLVYILTVFVLLMFFSIKDISLERKSFIYLCIATLIGFGALYFNGSGFGYVMLLIFPMFTICILFKISINKDFCNFLGILALCTWGLGVIASTNYTESYINLLMSGKSMEGLNPNMVALTLGATYWHIKGWILRGRFKKAIKFLSVIGLSLVTFSCIVLCRSRTSLAALLVVVIFDMFFGKRICLSKKLASVAYWGIIVAGILLPFGYVFIWKNTLLGSMSILGKNIFTGRQIIWINLFEYMKQNPKTIWIGTGYNTDFYIKKSFNLHNSYMQIFAEFGIIVFLIYFLFLFYVLSMAYKGGKISQNKRNYLMMGFFLLIVGYTETILINGTTLIFLVLSFGLLASQESWEENHVIKKNRKPYL